MTGLLPDWNSYNDSVNSISRPSQMGPLWVDASEQSGMPMDARVWVDNPPLSSYPACIAVKTAARQSPEAEELYLRKVREAVMLHGRDISQMDVLLDVAREVTKKHPDKLNYDEFEDDLINKRAIPDFRSDMDEVRQRHITRYPTLIIRMGEKGKVLTGFRPFAALEEVIKDLNPSLKPSAEIDLRKYESFWEGCTERELEEVKSSSSADSLAQ